MVVIGDPNLKPLISRDDLNVSRFSLDEKDVRALIVDHAALSDYPLANYRLRVIVNHSLVLVDLARQNLLLSFISVVNFQIFRVDTKGVDRLSFFGWNDIVSEDINCII